jgi:pimeloyl-ACP methyl ester carboxylesterase
VNDLDELKEHVVVHARGQRIPDYRELLDRIRTDGDGPGSWVSEWSAAAERLQLRGRHLDACRHYAMARFPYVDGPARQEALDKCVAALDRWRDGKDVHRLEVDLPDGRLRCWASGLSMTNPRPLVLIMGGIVSVKELWAPALLVFRRLGMAAVVVDMPGTGENTLPYGPESWRMLSELLDAIGDQADVNQTYALTLSFSGHMALRCAAADRRIRGVITTGAPISEFFTDAAWQRSVPRITIDTLAHMIGTEPPKVIGGLDDWALTDEELSTLDIPVSYMASLRDEIIPAGEVRRLRSHVRRLDILSHDDVHGAPRHVLETQLWTAVSLLRMRGARGPRSAAIGLLWRAQRARSGLTRRGHAAVRTS